MDKKILNKMLKSKRVAIFAHTNPDLDCMGSMAALSCMLNELNIENYMYVDAKKFGYFSGIFDSVISNLNNDEIIEKCDLLISVDVANRQMLGCYGDVFVNHKNTISIDHHYNRDEIAKLTYVDSKKSSCSEIIYELVCDLKVTISKDIANYIFAGIIGDTNCFQNDNTDASSLFVASKCCENGAENNYIVFNYFKRQSQKEVNIKKIGLNNFEIKNRIAGVIFTKKHFKSAGTDECGNFVNDLLNIEDNIFAYVIKQKEKNTYSVSLRCKFGYDVSKIAAVFGGGGHKQAAGLIYTGSPKKLSQQIYSLCIKQIEENNINV